MQADELEDRDFDADWYLSQNGDVAVAVEQGWFPSALAHFRLHGWKEGRTPRPPNGWAPKPSPAPARDPATDPSPDALSRLAANHNGAQYMAPADLAVSECPLKRVLLIGSCSLESWGFHKKNPSRCPGDFFMVNNAENLPQEFEKSIQDYNFQVIQIPLRSILPDHTLWQLPYSGTDRYAEAFEEVSGRLAAQLARWMVWNIRFGLTTFVANFLLPQRNPMGALFPRFDLRNPEFFIEKLNEHLEKQVRSYSGAYVLDIDRISASLGRRYVQDDSVVHLSHNALLPISAAVSTRMEPMAALVDHYEVRWPTLFLDSVWAELIAMYRTILQSDSVKLVVVDLDDTLWNGVSGDMTEIDAEMVEGWPLGLAEALQYLKKRGVLLGIISKNDEQRIRQMWPRIFGERLPLSDFAAVRINWRPKAENLSEMLSAVNLLPRSVLFLDDNPVERAEMQHSFPELRVLGRYPYYHRRILLWAPETQAAGVSEESDRRTQMVQAQLERESERTSLSRDDFLGRAAPQVKLFPIDGPQHPRFPRAFELINKTNQFNTTGQRWTPDEMSRFFGSGGRLWAFEAEDNYTTYGLIGVILTKGTAIEQWVMSCRILGYQIEDAVMAALVEHLRPDGRGQIGGCLVKTDANLACRELFRRCGFTEQGDGWVLSEGATVRAPTHVVLQSDALTVAVEAKLPEPLEAPASPRRFRWPWQQSAI